MKKLRPKRSKTDRFSRSDQTTATSMTASTSTSTIPIRFSVNVAIPPTADRVGRFVPAGSPSPYHDVSEVPESLRTFITSSVDQTDPDDNEPQNAIFVLNTAYDIDSRGFRRSRVGPGIVRLEQQAETQAAWERALSEPSEQEQRALVDPPSRFTRGPSHEGKRSIDASTSAKVLILAT